MNCEKRQTLRDVVASVISEGSDSEGVNITETYNTSKYVEDGPTPVKLMKVKRYHLHPKTYSPKWEEDPNYKGWVQRSKKGDGFYYCLACNQDYTCGKSELDKHASSRKHCMNQMSLPKQTMPIEDQNLLNNEQINLKSCDIYESESVFDNSQDFDASSTSGSFQVIQVNPRLHIWRLNVCRIT